MFSFTFYTLCSVFHVIRKLRSFVFILCCYVRVRTRIYVGKLENKECEEYGNKRRSVSVVVKVGGVSRKVRHGGTQAFAEGLHG